MLGYLRSILTGETNSSFAQFCRYVMGGGLAFVVDFTSLYLLHRFAGLHYLVAASLAFLLGLATIYTGSIVWIFDQRSVKNQVAEFTIFASLGLIGLGITVLTLYLLTGLLGVHLLFAKVNATAITFIWNFLSRKMLLFTRWSDITPALEG